MTHHLPLNTSRKIVELLWKHSYDTAAYYSTIDWDIRLVWHSQRRDVENDVPSPTIWELLLLLPKIEDSVRNRRLEQKLRWTPKEAMIEDIWRIYIENNGDMNKVAEVLESIIS